MSGETAGSEARSRTSNGARLRQFELEKWNRRPIVLCGVPAKVRSAADYLIGKGCGHSVLICDDGQPGQDYRGIPFIASESLSRHRQDNLLLGSKVFYQRYMRRLQPFALNDWFFMNQLFTDAYERKSYENSMFIFLRRRSEYFIMPGVELVVTQRCNLRCRHCANLMQYYTHPRNGDESLYLEAFDHLLQAVDGIADLKILGGEAFLLPERITRIVDRFGASERIFCIDIPTNGSLLLPETDAARLAGCRKLTVLPSDYGSLSCRLPQLREQLERCGIACMVYPRKSPWVDMGGMIRLDRPGEEVQQMYERCLFRVYCPTLLGSKLYPCPLAGHGTALGALPELQGEHVDLNVTGGLRERLQAFLARPIPFNACRYCRGGCRAVPRAVQADRPLPFIKIPQSRR